MKIVKLITFYIVLSGLISCSGDLNQLPKTQITEPNFYKTEEQFVSATNDIYRQLGIVYDAGGLVDLGAELRSDNTYIKHIATGPTGIGAKDITNFKMKTSNQNIQNAWQSGYRAIYTCDNIINRLKKTPITFSDPNLKKRLIAEATTIRSLIFFDMVRDWGAIILPLKPLSIAESYQQLREDKDVIYKQIIDDLKASEANLPESYSGNNKGRITKYGAAAILAKVYLRRKEIQKAKNELKKIIDSKLYSLDANSDGTINKDDYLYLFKSDTKNCKSSIIEAQYQSGPNGVNSNHQARYEPWDQRFHVIGADRTDGHGGNNTPTQDLSNEFEPADSIRKSISIAPGFYTLDTHQFVDFPYTRKFYDPDYLNAGQNFEIIRYADILLMYAEVTQDPSYLNKVRDRVGLPGYGEPGYPNKKYNRLEKAIEHERRMELCFEFHRFYDLTRKGRAIEVMKAKGYDIDKNKLVFPIPQHVIDVNPEIKQNPGYN